jgi:hypothetical protein
MAANKGQAPHETGDINVKGIAIAGVGLLALCIFSFLVVTGVFRFFLKQEAEAQDPARPGAAAAGSRMPPQPRLQSTQAVDLAGVRAAEDKILTTYGWVDQPKGIVRIPVDRAIDLLARRGLPSRSVTEPQSAASNVSVPTESGLGLVMQQPGGPLAAEAAKK